MKSIAIVTGSSETGIVTGINTSGVSCTRTMYPIADVHRSSSFWRFTCVASGLHGLACTSPSLLLHPSCDAHKDRCLRDPWMLCCRRPQDPEERKKKLAAELANGRLAMMAIIGRLPKDHQRCSDM